MKSVQRIGWLIASAMIALSGIGLILAALGNPLARSGQQAPTSVLLQTPAPAPTSAAMLVVHVAGAVAMPGVYELPADTRIADAVAVAGGLLPNADATSINLAAYLEDAQQIYVPVQAASAPATSAGMAAGAAAPFIVDVNTASVEELDQLPGVGPVLARRIVEYREQHGPFQRMDDLKQVPGIGAALLAEIAMHVRVSP